jgi:Zn-dependent peptidase ImmA (M78 family)
MKNVAIGAHETADLRTQVEKVLRGLGSPEPPLDLRDVRELLRLDRQYYSSTDDSAVREFVSRVKIAGTQILARPTILLDVIRKANLSALWVPDRKRILIDRDTPVLKHRWYEAHEIGHSLPPWHGEFLYGDSETTLSPMCHEQLEAEANYAAGQLLFLGGRFAVEALDNVASLGSVRTLAKRFGNTMTSTLWRYVEEAHDGRPMVGLVNPRAPFADATASTPHPPSRYCIESPTFRTRFDYSELQLLAAVNTYAMHRRGGPLGEAEIVLLDCNGDGHVFRFESFSNGHSTLTLAVLARPVVPLVAVPAMATLA